MGRPAKRARGKALARLSEKTLREISIDCEGSDLDRSDVLGEAIELWWSSPANKQRREAAFAYLSKKPKATNG